jgi:hypothetical protein
LELALDTHVILVLMMAMKRLFALTQERLRRARTGADLWRNRASQPPAA